MDLKKVALYGFFGIAGLSARITIFI